jgi:hypothetical protein
MAFVLEMLKGLILGFSVIIGMMLCIMLFVKLAMRQKEEYDPAKLAAAFSDYLQIVHDTEQFEEIREIEFILDELKALRMPEAIDKYKIITERLIKVDTERSSRFLKLITKYQIAGKPIKDDNTAGR